MYRFLLVLGIVVACGGAARGADFIPTTPKADAPASATEICERMNSRRILLASELRAKIAAASIKLDAARKAGVNPRGGPDSAKIPPFRSAAEKRATIATLEAEIAKHSLRLEELNKAVIFVELLPPEFEVNQVGTLDEKATIAQIMSPTAAIVEVIVYVGKSELTNSGTINVLHPTRKELVAEIETNGLADGSRIELNGPLLVAGTRRYGPETFFVLRPIDLRAYVASP